jgi:outer membrane PBP1 activator LpoA protein
MRAPGYEVPARAAAATDDRSSGWWALASLALSSFDLAGLRRGLVQWQRDYPDHPAGHPLPGALARISNPVFSPRTVALMVPLSGGLASAGTALRDGFLAAFYHGEADRRVLIYDTSTAPFANLYEQALADGADIIVGPLDKAAVSGANALVARLLPTLALNYLSAQEPAGNGFFQIGLAIEDEANAIAERILAEGLRRVVMYSTADDWSARAATQIRARLAGSDTELVSDTFIGNLRTITDVVGQSMLVPDSLGRRSELESTLGEALEFTARRRHDIDGIIALTDSVTSRALQPALAFHFASDIPVYATSQLTQGATHGLSHELDGVRLTQMPWRVFPDPVRDALEHALPGAQGDLDALYALGVDAYRIMDRAGSLAASSSTQILGATGMLMLDDRQAFRRIPVWALVRDGALVALPIVVPPA